MIQKPEIRINVQKTIQFLSVPIEVVERRPPVTRLIVSMEERKLLLAEDVLNLLTGLIFADTDHKKTYQSVPIKLHPRKYEYDIYPGVFTSKRHLEYHHTSRSHCKNVQEDKDRKHTPNCRLGKREFSSSHDLEKPEKRAPHQRILRKQQFDELNRATELFKKGRGYYRGSSSKTGKNEKH